MKRFESLTKFIGALESGELGAWSIDERACGPMIENMKSPSVEYWDVVWRFIESLSTLLETHPEYMRAGDEAAPILNRFSTALEQENYCPGILWGLLENGTIVDWLKALRSIDNN